MSAHLKLHARPALSWPFLEIPNDFYFCVYSLLTWNNTFRKLQNLKPLKLTIVLVVGVIMRMLPLTSHRPPGSHREGSSRKSLLPLDSWFIFVLTIV